MACFYRHGMMLNVKLNLSLSHMSTRRKKGSKICEKSGDFATWHCITLYHITSHHSTWHCITLYHITSHHSTWHCITLYHITSHHSTWHCITSLISKKCTSSLMRCFTISSKFCVVSSVMSGAVTEIEHH